MALEYTPSGGVPVQPGVDTKILEWTADGNGIFIGFVGTGTYSGLFTLFIDGEPVYTYYTSPSLRTAYVADRSQRLPAGTKVELHVLSDSQQTETFYGTILGGSQ
jgi:hypothetical protein